MPVDLRQLRDLIIAAAPDPQLAAPVARCGEDEPLDEVVPFSSVIVLGVVVAVEDRYRLRLTRAMLAGLMQGGVTLRKIADVIDAATEKRTA